MKNDNSNDRTPTGQGRPQQTDDQSRPQQKDEQARPQQGGQGQNQDHTQGQKNNLEKK